LLFQLGRGDYEPLSGSPPNQRSIECIKRLGFGAGRQVKRIREVEAKAHENQRARQLLRIFHDGVGQPRDASHCHGDIHARET
jgi:hypothetical protein